VTSEALPFRQAIRHPDYQLRLGFLCLALLFAAMCAAALLSISLGAVSLPIREIASSILGQADQRSDLIVWTIRLPRTLLAGVIGGSLGLSGAVMQGLFRNPLADPGLTGVSAGAALAAVIIIVLGQNAFGTQASDWLPLASFCGGLAVTVTLYAVATSDGRTSVTRMLLAGIAIGSVAGAITGLLIFVASEQQLREFTFWTLGSLGGATWYKFFLVGAFLVVTVPIWQWLARALDKLALGETEAAFAGLSVERVKIVAIVLTALLTGVSVSVSGMIGFVGLVVPHVLRLVAGPAHGFLLPASVLLGATLVMLADTFSRIAAAPAELPIGIVTACLGGPLFLWMLLRDRRLSNGLA
jgi:iron complex transport system permease protein